MTQLWATEDESIQHISEDGLGRQTPGVFNGAQLRTVTARRWPKSRRNWKAAFWDLFRRAASWALLSDPNKQEAGLDALYGQTDFQLGGADAWQSSRHAADAGAALARGQALDLRGVKGRVGMARIRQNEARICLVLKQGGFSDVVLKRGMEGGACRRQVRGLQIVAVASEIAPPSEAGYWMERCRVP